MFVLSIDYEVFLLTRMREAWLREHDHACAIEHGLRNTAGVITGAAVIMSSVFLAFATAGIASLQQFGAGLTFAVILDATVIRVVLLPAVMRAVGPRVWWLPGWLDRRLPHLDHGASAPTAATGETPGPVRELESVAHAEHLQVLELLNRLEAAGGRGDTARVRSLAREARAIAEPHFRYEQRALFPQLLGALGPDRVERLYADQDGAIEALLKIEALTGPDRLRESSAAKAQRLARAARASIESCDAACDAVEHQSPEVAERVLAARRRVLAAAGRPAGRQGSP
jgi:MMPL family/Hemerythrin HHE cation binding domain